MEVKGAINVYVCQECRMAVSTINLACGVTPMLTPCVVDECKGDMTSVNYDIKHVLNGAKISGLRVSHAWYRPKPSLMMGHDLKHVLKGGLVLDMLDLACRASYTIEPACSCDTHWMEFLQKAYASTQN